jgi:hypothetical protein
MWLAGRGIRRGITIGKTDDVGLTVVEEPVHIHNLQPTMLRCLGMDHTRLTHRHMGVISGSRMWREGRSGDAGVGDRQHQDAIVFSRASLLVEPLNPCQRRQQRTKVQRS